MSSRKGEVGPIGFIFLFAFLLFMYPFVIAPQLFLAGQNAIASGATGLDAFLWSNLNLWVIIVFILILLVYLRLSGGGQ